MPKACVLGIHSEAVGGEPRFPDAVEFREGVSMLGTSSRYGTVPAASVVLLDREVKLSSLRSGTVLSTSCTPPFPEPRAQHSSIYQAFF
jgi:hypothetical protein